MIYTVTFNPAIDYNMHIGGLKMGETNRSAREEYFFGGKGINVSCVLRELGEETAALGFTAGFTGEALEKGLSDMGIKTDFVRLRTGMTRINVKLKGECETEINAAGPHIEADELDALMSKLDSLNEGDTLVLAGSVPPSLPRDIYEMIMEKLCGRGIRTVVDAERDLVLRLLKYEPFLIKPNKSELSAMVGRELKDDADIEKAAREIKSMGAQNVLVSMGGDGALLIDESGKAHRAKAPKITPVGTVGAGDSMVAGFLSGINEGVEHALGLGIAAGSATSASAGLATRGEIFEMLERV